MPNPLIMLSKEQTKKLKEIGMYREPIIRADEWPENMFYAIQIPLTVNYDNTDIVGHVVFNKPIHLTSDTILTLEVVMGKDGQPEKVNSFTIIDRDNLITKSARRKRYGNKLWKKYLT